MAWSPLLLSRSSGAHLPALLISTSFKSDAYTIHLTDLTHIWGESLDRKAIIRRSRKENTSIDPSDRDQFTVFIEKIKLGLAAGQNTTLALTIDADAGRPCLILNVTVKLPGGLAPLEWPIRLSAAPQTALTNHLVIPLLRAQHIRTKEQDGLREVIKEKDHVIQKLLDKLETSGTDLGQIFPQAATGKTGRKVDRKKAEERVKGLGAFDMKAWRSGVGDHVAQDTAELVGDVFGGEDRLDNPVYEQLPEEEEGIWWESIKGITINLSTGKFSTNGFSKTKSTPPIKHQLKTDDSTDDEGFQVQSTPPHLSPSKKPKPNLTDEDDLDLPPQHSKIPDSYPQPQKVPSPEAAPKPAKKLGTLGGRKKAPEPPPEDNDESTADEAVPKPSKNIGSLGGKKKAPPLPPPSDDDESTADDASLVPKSSPRKRTPSPEPEPEPVQTVSRPKKGLGKLGGKKEVPPPPPPEPELEPVDEVPVPEPAKPKKSKLGHLGGKKKAPIPAQEREGEASSSNPQDSAKAKASASANAKSPTHNAEIKKEIVKEEKEDTPELRETTPERADRKRQALKRELEQKAKAPVKKRRKF